MLIGNAMSKQGWSGSRRQKFGPLRVVRRASTRVLNASDGHVSAALDMIREKACVGLTATDVAATFPCSRRMADIRFRRATGHSILAEIHAAQLERAQELARNPNLPLKAISDFCGFTNPNSLRKFFKKSTGKTLSAWRAE
jgi:transcriptional regulator GlxA family with amidase domain